MFEFNNMCNIVLLMCMNVLVDLKAKVILRPPNGVARRANLLGNGCRPPTWLRNLLRDEELGQLWPCGTSMINNETAQATAEFIYMQSRPEQARLLLLITTWRYQMMDKIVKRYNKIFLPVRHVPRRWGNAALILAPNGSIMG